MRILNDGELQLTAAERKEKVDKRHREIGMSSMMLLLMLPPRSRARWLTRIRASVTYINKYYVDPKTKLPHPVTRIENALDSMKVRAANPAAIRRGRDTEWAFARQYRVDPDTPTERQVLDIMKKLPEYLPVKKQLEIEGQLTSTCSVHVYTAPHRPLADWCNSSRSRTPAAQSRPSSSERVVASCVPCVR
mgnify:FL=1